MKHVWTFSLLTLLVGCTAHKKISSNVNEISVEKIWDKAPHSAFTDLVRFRNAWYCTFREAPAHVSGPVGRAYLIRSKDGIKWQGIDSFEMKGMDVRDPKLSITPSNRLMVLMDVETYKDGKIATRSPYYSVSDENGNNFSRPQRSKVDESITTRSDWVWRITWNKGVGYAVVYQQSSLIVLKTMDGSYFEKVSKLDIQGSPNESTIRFDKDDNMYVIVRRDGEDPMAVLAKSRPPYTAWVMNKMNYRLGGPNFLFLDDKTLCIGARLYEMVDGKLKPATAIFLSDLDGKIYKTIKLPSGGDTSYPGMVFYGDQLWVSYYSSHEGKTAVYLAKIPLSRLR
jgi:hypothetical protein